MQLRKARYAGLNVYLAAENSEKLRFSSFGKYLSLVL